MNTSPPALVLPDKVYFRIGEVADLLGVKSHVVRFWQQQFPTVRPERSRTGRFLYTKATVERLNLIKHLLYTEGYTIPGARKALRSETKSSPQRTQRATTNEASASSISGDDDPGPTNTAVVEAEAAAEALTDALAGARAELAAAQTQLGEIEGLRTQVDALRGRTEEVETLRVQLVELDGLRSQVGEIAALREALADAREEIASHAESHAALATARDEAALAETRAADLATALIAAQATLNHTEVAARENTAQLMAQLAGLKTAAAQSAATIAQLTDDAAAHEAALAVQIARVEATEAELQAAKLAGAALSGAALEDAELRLDEALAAMREAVAAKVSATARSAHLEKTLRETLSELRVWALKPPDPR